MKRWPIVVILAWALLLTTPLHAGKIYLMGGGYDDANTDLFVNGLRKATGRDSNYTPDINSTSNCGNNWATTACPRIAVVTSSKESYAVGLDAFDNDLDNGDGTVKRGYYNLFQTHGFSPRFITVHIDNFGSHAYSGNSAGDANIAIVNQADVVWFAGGDQARIARSWLKDDGSDTPLAAALRARWNANSPGFVVGGDSAGNHAMNAMMHGNGVSYGYLYYRADLPTLTVSQYANFGDTRDGLTALRYFENGAMLKGLSFLPATLLSDTHFDARSGRLGRLLAAMRSMGRPQGFGVDEDTGLLVDTGTQTARVYGSGPVIIADLSAATYPSGSYWKLSGARVSLLTAGDSYNYSSKSISSSKSLIGTRYYSGYYDSPDIFSAFETSRVLTRVVDQSASYNSGAAPAPDYSTAPFYPANAPTITLRFTRDGSSKGYYSAGRYTVVKARLDIY